MDLLLEESANPIHELELLPVYLATSLWVLRISGSQVVWYIDNESARMAAIRGSGETTFASLFIDAFVETECNSQIKSWFSPAPSHSNPADGVSRLLCDLPLSLGAEQATVVWESFRFLVQLLKEQDGPIISRELKILIYIFVFINILGVAG